VKIDSSNDFSNTQFLIESYKGKIEKLEELLELKSSELATSSKHISHLRSWNKKSRQTVVSLRKKIKNLQKKIVASAQEVAACGERTEERGSGNISEALEAMEHWHNHIFSFLKAFNSELYRKLQEWRRQFGDLKWYVAQSTSNEYFEQYCLKCMSVKNCSAAIWKKLSKHSKEITWFRQYFHEVLNEIFTLSGARKNSEQRLSFWENSLITPGHSVQRVHKKGSFSSLEILPPLPGPAFTQIHLQQPKSWDKKDSWEDGEFYNFNWEKSATDREQLSGSDAEPSIYNVYDRGDRESVPIPKSNHTITSSDCSTRESSNEILRAGSSRSPNRYLGQTPNTRARESKKFPLKAVGVFHAENSEESSESWNNDKLGQLYEGTFRKQSPKMRVIKRWRPDGVRTPESKNAFREGLGFPIKSYTP